MTIFYKINPNSLSEYCAEIFKGLGVPQKEATIVAESLVDADIRGVSSHGVVRVSNYVARLTNGGTRADAQMKVVHDTQISALIDADNGLGSVASEKAIDLVAEKARNMGIGIVLVKNSNHYGAAARWSLKLAGKDMVGITCSNVEPIMAATGGVTKGIGNNPISFAIPTGKFGTICYDVSCSQMAFGNILSYALMGKPLPTGAFLNPHGTPTTDPAQASILLPFAQHKGYGLAVIVEMLTSVLAGGNFGKEIGSQYNLLDQPNHISHFFMSMRIDLIRETKEYLRDADRFVEYLHQLPTQDGSQVLFPGEREITTKAQQEDQGLLLKQDLVNELIGYARMANVPETLDSILTVESLEE